MWARIIAFAAKYCSKSWKWIWNHKSYLLSLGYSVWSLLRNL